MLRLYFMAFTLQIVTATLYPYSQIVLRNLGYSQSLVGIILALGQLASCIAPLFISNLADRTGKTKLFYVFATLTIAIGHILYMNVPSLIFVILFFIVSYACAGSMTSLSDSLINLSINKIGGNYSNIRATGTIAYVITLTLFTIFQFPDNKSNNQILTALVSAALLQTFAIIISDNPVDTVDKKDISKFFDAKWFSRNFYLLILIIFIKSIACAVIEKLLGSYMTEVLNLGNRFAIFVALGALSEFIFMILFGKWLKQGKIKGLTLIKLSCIGLIVRLSLYAVSSNIYVFTFAQLFHCLTYAASHVAMIAYISKHIPKDHIGLATAIYSAIAINAAGFIGALGGGFIIDHMGYPALFKIYTIFPVIALVLCFVYEKRISE